MPSLEDVQISGQNLTSSEIQAYQQALGQTTCTNSVLARIVELFSLAFVATFIYILLELPPVNDFFVYYIPDFEYRFFTKVLLFFVLVYLLDRLVVAVRSQIDICDFKNF